MLSREATSETYGPRVYLHHINLPTLSYFCCFLLCFYFTLHLYHKNNKIIILSYLSDLTLVSDHVGIDNPLSRWFRGFICLCRYERLVVASYWIDTLVLKNWGKYLRYSTASPFPQGKTNASAQEVARRISGTVAGEVYAKVNIPSTHHIPLSPALHYLPFASRFPLPHFTLVVLFALSLYPPSLSLFASFLPVPRLLVC